MTTIAQHAPSAWTRLGRGLATALVAGAAFAAVPARAQGPESVADIAEPLPRTLAWSAAWEMTRDAELRARDFVALVMSGLHAESEVGVAQRLILQAQTALSSYADPGWAAANGWPAGVDAIITG